MLWVRFGIFRQIRVFESMLEQSPDTFHFRLAVCRLYGGRRLKTSPLPVVGVGLGVLALGLQRRW